MLVFLQMLSQNQEEKEKWKEYCKQYRDMVIATPPFDGDIEF